MIYTRESRLDLTQEFPVSVTAGTIIEGQALVAVQENGALATKPSAGSSGEVFLGIAFNQYAPQLSIPLVEVVTVGAGNTAKLSRKLTGNATNARFAVTGGSDLTGVTGTPSSGEVKVESDGVTLTFNAAQANAVVTVYFRTDLTQREAVALYGGARQPANYTATEALSSTGVILRGYVVTSEYDPTQNWTTGGAVKTGANGRFTLTASSPALTNVLIVKAPSVADTNLTLLVK